MSDDQTKFYEIQRGARAALALQVLGEELAQMEQEAITELRYHFQSGSPPESFQKGVAVLATVGELRDRFVRQVNTGREHDPIIKEE